MKVGMMPSSGKSSILIRSQLTPAIHCPCNLVVVDGTAGILVVGMVVVVEVGPDVTIDDAAVDVIDVVGVEVADADEGDAVVVDDVVVGGNVVVVGGGGAVVVVGNVKVIVDDENVDVVDVTGVVSDVGVAVVGSIVVL